LRPVHGLRRSFHGPTAVGARCLRGFRPNLGRGEALRPFQDRLGGQRPAGDRGVSAPDAPGDSVALYYARDAEGAIRQFNKILVVNPNLFMALWRRGEAYAQISRYEEAIEDLTSALEREKDHPEVMGELGYIYARAGRLEDARRMLVRLSALREGDDPRYPYVSHVAFAVAHVGLGEAAEAFAWLDRAVEERDEWLVYLLVDPVFDSIRTEPAFKALLAKVGFPH
jgi:tetratricopeptide (TPR) repeat protein